LTSAGDSVSRGALRLYKKVPCLFCQRVRIGLAEKGLLAEEVVIDAASKPGWFLALSPFGKIPVLVHGEAVVFESAVILEYLEDAFPDAALMPVDPVARAHLRVWIDFANTRLHPAFMALLGADAAAFDERVRAFESCLGMIEDTLARTGMPGPYFAGSRFTLADAAYAPSFERFAVLPALKAYGVPDRFARIGEWRAALAARDSVRACADPLEAHMENCRRYLPR
jgi:glutathione S-transferase